MSDSWENQKIGPLCLLIVDFGSKIVDVVSIGRSYYVFQMCLTFILDKKASCHTDYQFMYS